MYDSSLKYKWDNKNILDYAVQEERKKTQKDIAREMIKDGLPHEQISKFTKLSIEEIERL